MSPKESREEMLRMQQDAVRRVREMQERARRTLEQSQAGTARSPSTEPKPRQEAPSPKPAQPNGPRTGRSFVAQPLKRAQEHHAPKGESPHPRPFPPNVPPGPSSPSPDQVTPLDIGGILKGLGMDGDRLLLLGLAFLLISEGADRMLILAVVYTML